jgi:hypothetical protein
LQKKNCPHSLCQTIRTWKEAVLGVQFLVPVWFLSLIFVISKTSKRLAKLVESENLKNPKYSPLPGRLLP